MKNQTFEILPFQIFNRKKKKNLCNNIHILLFESCANKESPYVITLGYFVYYLGSSFYQAITPAQNFSRQAEFCASSELALRWPHRGFRWAWQFWYIFVCYTQGKRDSWKLQFEILMVSWLQQQSGKLCKSDSSKRILVLHDPMEVLNSRVILHAFADDPSNISTTAK